VSKLQAANRATRLTRLHQTTAFGENKLLYRPHTTSTQPRYSREAAIDRQYDLGDRPEHTVPLPLELRGIGTSPAISSDDRVVTSWFFLGFRVMVPLSLTAVFHVGKSPHDSE
jgi:hypothetical protein